MPCGCAVTGVCVRTVHVKNDIFVEFLGQLRKLMHPIRTLQERTTVGLRYIAKRESKGGATLGGTDSGPQGGKGQVKVPVGFGSCQIRFGCADRTSDRAWLGRRTGCEAVCMNS